MPHYVYKITFETGHIYYGSRSCNCLPEEDISYLGSPVVFKDFWVNNTPTKIILKTFDTRLEANEAENFLINWQWNSTDEGRKYSLNGCIMGVSFSMLGVKTSEKQKRVTRERTQKPYYLVSPEGEVFEGINLTEFCKEQNLKRTNLVSVMKGNKFHYKGWTKSLSANKLYKDFFEMRGIGKPSSKNKYIVSWRENGKKEYRNFKTLDEAKKCRDQVNYCFLINPVGWREKLKNYEEGLHKLLD